MAREPAPPARDGAERPMQIRVALYDDVGGSSSKRGTANCRGAAHFESCLRRGRARVGEFKCKRLTGADIAGGALRKGRFHVLVQPGGEGVAQGRTIGAEGMQNIRDFVARGGGYVGVCAGNNLASSDPNYMPHSLGLVNSQTLDSVPEYPFVKNLRGTATADFEFTSLGQKIFNTEVTGCKGVVYANGPLIMKGAPNFEDPLRSGFKVLATYTSEVNVSEYGREVKGRGEYWQMKGKPAAVAAPYGEGRVLCMSPHPEKPSGPNWMIRSAVRWAAGTGPDVGFIPTYQTTTAADVPLDARPRAAAGIKRPPVINDAALAASLRDGCDAGRTDSGGDDADDDDVLDTPVYGLSRNASRDTVTDMAEEGVLAEDEDDPTAAPSAEEVVRAAARAAAQPKAGRTTPRRQVQQRRSSLGGGGGVGSASRRRAGSHVSAPHTRRPSASSRKKTLPGRYDDGSAVAAPVSQHPPPFYPFIHSARKASATSRPAGGVNGLFLRGAARPTPSVVPTTPPIAPKDVVAA